MNPRVDFKIPYLFGKQRRTRGARPECSFGNTTLATKIDRNPRMERIIGNLLKCRCLAYGPSLPKKRNLEHGTKPNLDLETLLGPEEVNKWWCSMNYVPKRNCRPTRIHNYDPNVWTPTLHPATCCNGPS
ncbi:hypothetical protein AG1IA_04107 [Rhizoctonia solani AG-1 IA]|uniref:Uncharacterized protein n=1 Tax=Thanatephorus cucumeris (strain AG1-IA) TaxID=983506 RepID=L8WUR2_THACA|nr:hypothetical protein AG1IA_04107 [Rhizoctonia solani AG-1 IA]